MVAVGATALTTISARPVECRSVLATMMWSAASSNARAFSVTSAGSPGPTPTPMSAGRLTATDGAGWPDDDASATLTNRSMACRIRSASECPVRAASSLNACFSSSGRYTEDLRTRRTYPR